MIYSFIIHLLFLETAVIALPLLATRRAEAAYHDASDASGRTSNLLFRRSPASGSNNPYGQPFPSSSLVTRAGPVENSNQASDVTTDQTTTYDYQQTSLEPSQHLPSKSPPSGQQLKRALSDQQKSSGWPWEEPSGYLWDLPPGIKYGPASFATDETNGRQILSHANLYRPSLPNSSQRLTEALSVHKASHVTTGQASSGDPWKKPSGEIASGYPWDSPSGYPFEPLQE